MKISVKIGDNTFLISPYTTKQEKDILLSSSFDVKSLDSIFEILNFDISNYDLSEEEKKVLLYSFREISVGDSVDIQFKCDNCGQINDTTIEASNFIKYSKENDVFIKKINKKFKEENAQEYVDLDLDELDIDEYDEIIQKIKDNQDVIDFNKKSKCMICQTEKEFYLGDIDYIIDIMSEDNLMSLYKSYNHLTFFGNYTKEDIDSMYPFERTIFIGLLNKTKEDLSQ